MKTHDQKPYSYVPVLIFLLLPACDSRESDQRNEELYDGQRGQAGTTSASGGSAGAATAPLPTPMNLCGEAPIGGADPLIDDAEDGDTKLLAVDSRSGGWFVVNDKTGVQVPTGQMLPEAGEGAEGSAAYMRTSGTNFTEWGAAIGLNFYGNPSCPYDAAAFEGLRFFARGKSTVSVQISTAGTVPVSIGGDGSCQQPGGTPDQGCYGTHRTDVALTADWAEYVVRWDDLVQPEWGTPAVFDPTRVIAVQWTVLEEQALDFEFAIDQVSFVTAGGAP